MPCYPEDTKISSLFQARVVTSNPDLKGIFAASEPSARNGSGAPAVVLSRKHLQLPRNSPRALRPGPRVDVLPFRVQGIEGKADTVILRRRVSGDGRGVHRVLLHRQRLLQ